MEGSCMLETPVLLLENFDEESQMLYQSFRTSGFDGPVFTFSDEGFLPEDVTSIYTYYCGKKEGGKANVIKLRDDEPSGYYCLDGNFI